VEQNDKNGIITKIRIKLFQGKIWNKVARLASKSEFNVETTSAIAGVRGTEFGIDADKNTIIILNGKVEFQGGQIVTSDGTVFNEYDIPKDDNPIGDAVPINFNDQQGKKLLNDYYQPVFNNNVIPRIISIDTVGGNTNKAIFYHIKGVNKVFAIDENGAVIANPDFTDNDPDDITVSIEELLYKGPVSFRFTDIDGNETGLSNPAISLVPEMLLTEAQIYNDVFADEQEEQQQQGGAPTITYAPNIVYIGGASEQLTADEPCVWTLDIPSYGYLDNNAMTQNVNFYSYNPALDNDELQLSADITQRFNNQDSNNVTVTCTDADNETDTAQMTIGYAPKAVSDNPPNGSAYQYSFLAGQDTWDNAKTACANSQEGGLAWTLPSIGDNAGGIDIADADIDNLTSQAEIDLLCKNAGNVCTDLGATGKIWLLDELDASNAFGVNLFNKSVNIPIDKAQNRAYRCIAQ